MSGIAGILNVDSAPVDRQLLDRMTRFMRYRGPDDQGVWADGHIGFGHTMLRTSSEWQRGTEPCSLDAQVWITADARVDDRESLVGKLNDRIGEQPGSASDAELILHAYSVWGEDCVRHLLGDFAFAIWDGRRRRLFCARDHFGVKPFFYASSPGCFIFSNTLNALRLHPAVSDALNELAIGDFLLFDFNQDPATTTFADIHRLPPAHYLTWSAEHGVKISRYWSLSVDGGIIRYKNPGDYIDRFKELLREAVGDRVRTDSVAISQSGGLDSTALAATVCQIRAELSKPRDVRSYCLVYDKLFADNDHYYASLATGALGIRIEYVDASRYGLFERMDKPELFRPEPMHDPLLGRFMDVLDRTAARGSRVLLFGEDPDALLCPSTVVDMLKGMPFGDVVGDVVRYVSSYWQRPPLGLGIYDTLNRWFGRQSGRTPYPQWLNPDFEARLELRRRWEEHTNDKSASIHPIRPRAYRRLTQPLWPWFLEYWDPGTTLLPVEVRFPYLDVRLVDYLLAIPSLPWCVNKELLRVSMRGMLPEAVRLRPKTPPARHPYDAVLRRADVRWIDEFEPTAKEAQFINRAAVPPIAERQCDPNESWVNLRPLSLNCWLQSQRTMNIHSLQTESV